MEDDEDEYELGDCLDCIKRPCLRPLPNGTCGIDE